MRAYIQTLASIGVHMYMWTTEFAHARDNDTIESNSRYSSRRRKEMRKKELKSACVQLHQTHTHIYMHAHTQLDSARVTFPFDIRSEPSKFRYTLYVRVF